MKESILFGTWTLFIWVLSIASFLYFQNAKEKPKTVQVEQPELTSWQIFTLALIEVESEFTDNTRTDTKASGMLQITPIFVKECNRLHGTTFEHEDALDADSAIVMFNLLNPEKDIDIAIKRHNLGAGEWYRKRVYKAMEKIRMIELIRKKV